MNGLLSSSTIRLLTFSAGATVALVGIYAALLVVRRLRSGDTKRAIPGASAGVAVIVSILATASAVRDLAKSFTIDWRSLLDSVERFVSSHEFQIAAAASVFISVINSLFYRLHAKGRKEGAAEVE